jgi:hypothetical protein
VTKACFKPLEMSSLLSFVGSHTRLGNGPAYRPRAPSNSEPRRCASRAFFFILLPSPVPSLFRVPASRRHPPPTTPPASLSFHHRRLAHARLRHCSQRARRQHIQPTAAAFPFAVRLCARLSRHAFPLPPPSLRRAVHSRAVNVTSARFAAVATLRALNHLKPLENIDIKPVL